MGKVGKRATGLSDLLRRAPRSRRASEPGTAGYALLPGALGGTVPVASITVGEKTVPRDEGPRKLVVCFPQAVAKDVKLDAGVSTEGYEL